MEEKLKQLLTRVLDDATTDVSYPNARHWSLRSKLRREIMEAIDYKYDSKRAMETEEYPR